MVRLTSIFALALPSVVTGLPQADHHGTLVTRSPVSVVTGAATVGPEPCAGGEIYDDGEAEFGYGASHPNETYSAAQLFSPAAFPATYRTVCIGIASSAGSDLDFQIQVWDDDGPGGEPGTLLESTPRSVTGLVSVQQGCRFFSFDITELMLSIPAGEVWIGVEWDTIAFESVFDSRFICADSSSGTPPRPSLQKVGTGSWSTPNPGTHRALLIRASEHQLADLAIAKDGDVNGTSVTYTLEATNHGPGPASGVTVTDELPAELTYVGDDCGGIDGPPWTWSVGVLASGASTTCTITATVDPTFTGFILNTAAIEGAEPDPDPTNNMDSLRLHVALAIPTLHPAALAGLVLLLVLVAVRQLRSRGSDDGAAC